MAESKTYILLGKTPMRCLIQYEIYRDEFKLYDNKIEFLKNAKLWRMIIVKR